MPQICTALLRIIYPPQYIGRGMSINAMLVAVSIAAGPSLAGAILSVASWHWLFAINVAGRNEVETGLLLTPWPVATMLTAPVAGRLVEKFHPGLLGAIGMLTYSAGLYLLATLPAAPTDAEIAWRLILCGAGFGLFQTPNNSTMIASAPPHRSGGANGMQGTARLLGQTMGTTLVALIFRMVAPAQGMQTCMYVALGFALTAAVISSLRVSQPAPMRRK